MADHNININIKDTTGAKAGATPSGRGKIDAQIDPTSIQKLDRAFQKTLSKSLNLPQLGSIISKAISKEMPVPKGQQAAGASKTDVQRIINQVSNDLAKRISQSILSGLSKLSAPGTTAGQTDKRIVDSISNMDRHIQSAVRDLNIKLKGHLGAQAGPDIAKNVADAVSGAVSKAIPKSLDKAADDLSKAVSGIQSILKEITTVATSIKKMRQSGGGVDITEIKPIIDSVARLLSEFKKLPGEIKQARESAKAIAREEKQTYQEFSKVLTDIRKSTRERVTRVKEKAAADPAQFAKIIAKELSKVASGAPALRGTKIEQVLSGLEKKVDNVSDITKAIKDLEGEIKSQVSGGRVTREGAKDLVKTLENLNNNLKGLPQVIGSDKALDRLEKFTQRTEKLLKTVNTLIDVDVQIDEKAVKKQLDSIAKDVKLEVDVDLTGLKEVDKLIDKIAKKGEVLGLEHSLDVGTKVKKFKGAMSEGKPGVARNVLLDLKQIPALNEFKDALSDAADSLAIVSESDIKKVGSKAKKLSDSMDKLSDTVGATHVTYEKIKKNEERRLIGHTRATRQALETYKIRKYPEEVIPAGKVGFRELETTGVSFGKDAEKSVKENVAALAESLRSLQKHMISVLEKELTESSKGWDIVRESSEQAVDEYFKLATGGSIGNIKQAGKQWAIQIADIARIRKELGKGFEAASPAQAVKAFRESLIEKEVTEKTPGVRPQEIAKWIKTASKETIKSMDSISAAQKEAFLEIKDSFKGVAVSEGMSDAVRKILGSEKEIERIFRKTYAVLEAERKMIEGFVDDFKRRREPVLKTLAIPAAKLTETGATAFETAAGSLRAIPKFATFKTGFERLYEDLSKASRLPLGEDFSKKVRRVGIRPTGAGVVEAENLAKELLKTYASAPEFKGKVPQFYKEAAVPRGLELEKAGIKNLDEFTSEIEKAIGSFKQLPAADKTIDNFIDAMDKAGLSAYDVVKSLDELRFENIYDVLKTVITKPTEKVGREPFYERSVRQFEETSRQLEQLLPLIEPGKPRRGLHQESVLKLFTRASDVYKGFPVELAETKDVIKDLNIRLGELVSEAKELRSRGGEEATRRLESLKIPEAVRELSTLGVPESLASKITELRPGKAGEGLRHLEELNRSTLTLYTENLRELSPLGEQFQNWARNITSVSNALASTSEETKKKLEQFGGGVEGAGTEFPTLRTEREREFIAGGRYGRRGYGFNVLAELRTTASTFEDQVLISGKIADALTSITKTLVRPGVAGKLRQFREETAVGVGEVDEKLLRDVRKSVNEVSDKIQDVLGVPERYKGRADRALIQEVTKAITIVRGKEVEVQAAKLAEVFLNYFGRKITTRFGSKGVAVTPTAPRDLRGVIEQYGDKPMKVLGSKERKRAGLGVAITPKTMGQLASEILQESTDELMKKGVSEKEIKSLSTSLVNSGNRFMIDLFKQAGLVAEDEIKIDKAVFTRLKNALSKLDEDLAGDIEGIEGLKEIHKKRVGKPMFEEKPIDVRISAHGIGKRGLQTEVLETVLGNVMGLTPAGRPATIKPTIKDYKELLKGPGALEPGRLSKYAEVLGFERAVPGKPEQIYEELSTKFKEKLTKGKEGEAKQAAEEMAERLAELEAISNYYVDVIDELKTKRKGIVGPKFAQIVEEPHLFEEWSEREVGKGVKGERLNLPAFAAYNAIFGEQSAFMEEIRKASTIDTKEAFEYIKALQTVGTQNEEFKKLLTGPLKTVDLFDIKDFTDATGTLEDFKDTILDVQKFPGPFKVKIPSPEKGGLGKYEELYVPGAEARGSYEESLIAGERSPKVITRRLANLISSAKRVETLRSGFAEVESQIKDLEAQLSRTEDPQEVERINQQLSDLFNDLEALYSKPERVESVKRQIIESTGAMLKRVQMLAKQGTGREEIEDILGKMMSTLSETEAAPPGFGTTTTLSEKAVFDRMLSGQPDFETYADAARRMSDLIIGVSEKSNEYLRLLESSLREITSGELAGPATGQLVKQQKYFQGLDVGSKQFEKRLKDAVERQRQRVGAVSKVEKAAETGQLASIGKKLGVTLSSDDKDFEKAVASLARAKIDYYDTIAKEVLGKGGAVERALLSRTLPAVMAKAISATVDKTEELRQFSRDLKDIYERFGDFAGPLSTLKDVAQEALSLEEEHAERIKTVRETGVPVLKQYELGVPPALAKKLPVKYTPKFRTVGKELEEIPENMRKEVESTLFDLLKEVETLSEGKFITGPGKTPPQDKIQKYIDEELVPYIESVRFPFTGISTVQPFKPKLAKGQKEQFALAVPGMPDLDFERFDEMLDKVKSVRDVLEKERSTLEDTPEGIKKREGLTNTIDELNRAISRVIPKYLSHEQKLDFDGDAIEIHTAATKEARQDIKKHFDALAEDIDSTRAVFRDFFTYGAKQEASGKFVLAEMAKAFEKKQPFEKGFEFLRKPFLEREMAALTPAEQLGTLSGRPGIKSSVDAIKEIVAEFVRVPAEQEKALDAIGAVTEKTEKNLVDAIKGLGGETGKLILSGIKSKAFEERYKDAIEAQLYKIHTGPEVEALYRVTRVAESFTGFGGGQIDPSAASRAEEQFKQRWPRTQALGGKPEFEFQTMMNELLRFGIQKGMDVKHAGELPVAGEMARELSKGAEAAEKLFERIVDENESAFSELRDFVEQNAVAIGRRLGRLTTGELRGEAKTLREARGMRTGDIEHMDRPELEKEITGMIGFKGFLVELAKQIKEQAIEGLVKEISSLPPSEIRRKTRGATDIRRWAKQEIEAEAAGMRFWTEAIDVKKHIISQRQPLYMKRVSGASPEAEGRLAGRRGMEFPDPDFIFAGMSGGEINAYKKKFKDVQATAASLARDLKRATEDVGGGAYADMVTSSIQNIYDQQQLINKEIVSKLGPEGFAANIPDVSVVERVMSGVGVSEFTKNIIGDPDQISDAFIKGMGDQVSKLSELVGVGIISQAEKFELEQEALGEFAKIAEKSLEGKQLSKEEFNKRVENMAESWLAKAQALRQIDKIIETVKAKKHEPLVLRAMLPSPEELKKVTKENIKPFAAEQAKTMAFAAAERERMIKTFTSGAVERAKTVSDVAAARVPYERAGVPSGAAAGGLGSGDCIPVTNCGKPLDVFVVGAAGDVKTLLASDRGTARGGIAAAASPAVRTAREELLRFTETVTGNLNKLAGDTFENIYRASGLKAGGTFAQRGKIFAGGQVNVEKLMSSQLQGIMENMLGLVEESPKLEASAFLGTALHSKIQNQLKKKFGEKVEFEKFVKYEDEAIGMVVGHIDATFKDAAGNIEKIVDIKTTGDTIVNEIGRGVVDLDDVLNKSLSYYTRQKIEETASQINLYLAAVAQQSGQAAEGIVGQAEFYSRLEPGKDPAKIRIKFDPERLKRDIEAVAKSRELIQKYIVGSEDISELSEAQLSAVSAIKKRVGTKKPEFARTGSLKELESLSETLADITEEQIHNFVKLATDYYKSITGTGLKSRPMDVAAKRVPYERVEINERVRQERELSERLESTVDVSDLEKPFEPKKGADAESLFQNLSALHEAAKAYQNYVESLDFGTAFAGLNEGLKEIIKEVMEQGKSSGAGARLSEAMDSLREEGAISQKEVLQAWKLYRIALGDFFIRQASEAREAVRAAGDDYEKASKAYGELQGYIKRFQESIISGLGKQTDIYARQGKFVAPDIARAAGVYLDPGEIRKKTRGSLGEDERLRELFKMVTESEESPLLKARDVVSQLTNMDSTLVDMLNNADLVVRKGAELKNAWDFSPLIDNVIRLRAALQGYLRFNVREDFTVVQRKNIQEVVKLLGQAERSFAKFSGARPGGTGAGGGGKWGETGVTKVMPWLDPQAQRALHMQNIANLREYFKQVEESGGPQVGERFTYIMKVLDQTGSVVKNTAFDFHKYGEFVNKAGEAAGAFTEKQRDLIQFTQGANRTFAASLRRVTMWGAAATVVYGGISQLKSAIGTLADIETGIAQLRMVMSPLETDFDRLGRSAVDFAKEFGTGVDDVLKGMRIFAQQGLAMADVIERTRVSTLAANVTTLNAKDATEAITSAAKVFRQEGESTIKFIDAWSEVEAKHAITSADMAQGLRKAASAGKNAGFTFDQLNGIIAAIGAVTRQTGKEVGTSLRFVFRRLSAEEGPKALAKIGIPTITETGEIRKGFDTLSDLADAWKDLTSAQKLSISQAIGGTRQYNQVLVLMDNWEEAISATRDSINSVGSAQRKNQEIMKTYTKQLQQTKAAAVELQMAFGKAYLPIAKFGLKGLKFLLESLTAIPNSVKAASTAFALLITYIAKGDSLLTSLGDSLGKGSQYISEFFDEFKKGVKISGFEIFGLGKGKEFEGLKTLTEGKSMKDFHSALGKSAYLVSNLGKTWNRFIADMAIGTGKAAETFGETTATVGKGIQAISPVSGIKGIMAAPAKAGLTRAAITETLRTQGLRGAAQVGKSALGIAGAITAAVAGSATEFVGDAIDTFGEGLGSAGQKFLKDFAGQNAGLVKSTAPLIISFAALVPVMKSVFDYYGRITKSAQDYEESVYGVRRANESELSTIRMLIQDYDNLESRLEDVRKAEEPETKARRMELGTYESPLLLLADIQKDAAKTANLLADTNINLVAGYDKLGNAVLRTVGNFKEYLKQLEKLKIKEMAEVEVDVLQKYIDDLTEIEGPEKWKSELQKLLKEAPVFGDIIGKQINIAPAKALSEVTNRLNDLVALKNKFPISTTFDKDIKKYQESLRDVRTGFEQTYRDFRRVLSEVSTEGLDRQDIAELFGREELRRGYELIVDVEPKFQIADVRGKVDWKDVLGSEVLRRVFPEAAPVLDVTSVLTEARLETSSIRSRSGKAMAGDIITFWGDAAEQYNIAGNQAFLSMRETTEGIFEWIITYFNTKTLEVEERPFTEELKQVVDNVFPVREMQEELSDRIEVFNEFVAGAAAGLRGVSAKDFKRDFGLGERFFSEIPTTTILQGTKGFTPGAGFGVSPLQKEWDTTIKEFFFKPMEDYRMKVEQLGKLRLEGLEGGEITIATGLHEELVKLQEILKNNQVVLQYRAVLVDLTKTMEEASRATRENIMVERDRVRLERDAAGYMKDVAQGLESVSLGAQKFSELTARQRALRSDSGFRTGVAGLRESEIERTSVRENVYAVNRALSAIESIRDVARGFGASLTPEDLEKYTEVIARTGDKGVAEMVLETRKVEQNTSETVDRLDRILENMGDQAVVEEMLSSLTDTIGSGLQSSQKTVNALERVARIRERFQGEGNREVVMASNKAIDLLVKNLVTQVGVKKAMEMVEDNTTLFKRRFKPEEFAQRAFGGIDYKEFEDRMSSVMKGERRWSWRLMNHQVEPAFENLEEVEKLKDLQKQTADASIISAKNAIKVTAGLAAFQHFNKSAHNKTIVKLEDQIKQLDAQVEQAKAEGKSIEAFTRQRAVYGEALETEKAKLEFDTMVQSVSALTAGTMTFAKALGLTESQIKQLGGAAVGTYAAVKLVSSITGREMPESAKEFGSKLKEITKKAVTGEDVGYLQAREVRKAGESFMKDYGSAIKDGAKGFKEQMGKAAVPGSTTAQVQIPGGGTMEDFKKEAENIRQDVGKSITREEGTKRIRQLVLTYVTATMAGYAASRTEDKTRLSSLNNLAEKQAETFADIVRKYPEEAQKVIEQMKKASGDMVREGTVSDVPTEIKSLVMDTEKERKKVVSDMQTIREALVKEHENITEEMEKAADKLAKIEIAKQFEMEIEELNRAVEKIEITGKVDEKIRTALKDWSSIFYEGVAKFPGAGGKLAGKYRPQPMDFGVRGVADMTPEEYLVATGSRVGYRPTKAISALARFETPAEGAALPPIGELFKSLISTQPFTRLAEDMFKEVAMLEEEQALKRGKLEESMLEKLDLERRRGILGTGLSAGEEKRYDLLGSAIKELTEDVEGLAVTMAKAKERIRSEVIDAQIELFELVRERDYEVARAVSKTISDLKTGRGILAGAAIPQGEIEFGPKTFRELSAYQVAYQTAMEKAEKAPIPRGFISILKKGFTEAYKAGEGLAPIFREFSVGRKESEAAKEELKNLREYESSLTRQAELIERISEMQKKITEAEIDDDREAAEKWADALNRAKEELSGVTKEINNLSVSAEKQISVAEKLQRAREKLYGTLESLSKLNIDRFFGDVQSAISSGLRGFTGELMLPVSMREMSAQQRLFATGGDAAQSAMASYRAMLDIMAAQATRIQELVSLRGEEYQRITQTNKASAEGKSVIAAATEKYNSLTKEIDSSRSVYEDIRSRAESMGNSLKNAASFMDYMKSSAEALTELRVSEIVEGLPGVRRSREMSARLLGGGHPLARQAVAPAEERAAMMGGVALTHMGSTQYDKELASLMGSLTKAEGEEYSNLLQQVFDLPEKQRRDIEVYNQNIENARINNQRLNAEQRIQQLVSLRERGQLEEEAANKLINVWDNAIGEMMQEIPKEEKLAMLQDTLKTTTEPSDIRSLKEQIEIVSKAGATQFMGLIGKSKKDVEDVERQTEDSLIKALSSEQASLLERSLRDPIVSSLDEQTNILKEIAKYYGIDIKEAAPGLKPEEALSGSRDMAMWQKIIMGTTAAMGGTYKPDMFKGDEAGMAIPDYVSKKVNELYRFFKSPGKYLSDTDKKYSGSLQTQEFTDKEFKFEQGDLGIFQSSVKIFSDSIAAMRSWSENFSDVSEKFVRRWTYGMFAPTEETKKFSSGGFDGPIRGPGTSTSDSILARLSDGEYVVKTSSAKKLGYGALDYINKHGEMPAAAEGGMIDKLRKVLHADELSEGIDLGPSKFLRDIFSKASSAIVNTNFGDLAEKTRSWLVDIPKEERLKLVKQLPDEKNMLMKILNVAGGQAGLAMTELIGRGAQSLLDTAAFAESLARGAGTFAAENPDLESAFGTAKKTAINFAGMAGRTGKYVFENPEVLKELGSKAYEAFVDDLSTGGLGITAGILSAMVGMGRVKSGAKAISAASDLAGEGLEGGLKSIKSKTTKLAVENYYKKLSKASDVELPELDVSDINISEIPRVKKLLKNFVDIYKEDPITNVKKLEINRKPKQLENILGQFFPKERKIYLSPDASDTTGLHELTHAKFWELSSFFENMDSSGLPLSKDLERLKKVFNFQTKKAAMDREKGRVLFQSKLIDLGYNDIINFSNPYEFSNLIRQSDILAKGAFRLSGAGKYAAHPYGLWDRESFTTAAQKVYKGKKPRSKDEARYLAINRLLEKTAPELRQFRETQGFSSPQGGIFKTFASGGTVPEEKDGIFKKIKNLFGSSDDSEIKEPPLGTGMLRQTADDIKKVKAERERQMKEFGFNEGSIVKYIMDMFGSESNKEDIKEAPLGTGMLHQTAEEIKKRKEEEKRQLDELMKCSGGRIKRYNEGGSVSLDAHSKPIDELSFYEAQQVLGGSVGLWMDMGNAKRLLEKYQTVGVKDKSKDALRQMELNIQQASNMLNSIRTGDFSKVRSPEELITHQKLSKAMQTYSTAHVLDFQKQMEELFGADWHTKIGSPRIPHDVEERAKFLNFWMKSLQEASRATGLTLDKSKIQIPEEAHVESMFSGGRMKRDGLTYLHGGEVVIPEKYADEAASEPLSFDKNVLNSKFSVDINTDEVAEKMEEAITKAIRNAEFPKIEVTDDLPMLDVDVTDKKVGLETTVVTLDAANAVSSIEAALRNAKIAPGAVGAERIDKVEQLLEKMDSLIFDIKEDVEGHSQEIELLGSRFVDKVVVTEMLKTNIDPLITEIYRKDSTSDEYRREIENIKQHLGARVDMLENHLNRVTTHVGGA